MTFLKTAALLGVLFMVSAVIAQEQKATINVTVVRESSGKPVKNAEVVLHLVKNGREKQEGLELKTHEDGKAGTGGIPYGTLRVQVIARGFRTYGQDFEINQPSMEITIKLQKPKSQFSIYK